MVEQKIYRNNRQTEIERGTLNIAKGVTVASGEHQDISPAHYQMFQKVV